MELPTSITAATERTDEAEAILVDFSDGLEALMAVPVCDFLVPGSEAIISPLDFVHIPISPALSLINTI